MATDSKDTQTPASEPAADEEDEIADSSVGGGVGPLELRKIGKYRIGDKTLGTGQFCTVKVGYHEGRKVALKIVKPKWAKQDSDAVNEMKMLRRVTHKNVIRLIDGQLMVSCPKKDGSTFETDMLVLELAEATLSEILFNTGKFEEPFARACFRQLIEGIEKCHEMGVVHRDLKPEQLLVCTEDKSELKVADFGLGKMYALPEGVEGEEHDSKSVHHGIVDAASVGDHAVQLPICRYWADKDDVGGTPAFMAPEVFALWKEDEPTKDLLDAEATELLDRSGYPEGSVPLRGYDCVPVDVWGCALVLFWLLAGTHPFNLRTRPCQWWFKRVMNRDRSAFWEYVTSQGLYFSLGVQDLINKMLHPEPLKRMTIAEIKSHSWYNEQVPTQTALRAELEERLATTLKNKRLEQLQREKEERELKDATKNGTKVGATSSGTSSANGTTGGGDSAMERLRAHKAREAKLKEEKAAAAASRADEARKERIAAEKHKEERRAEQQRKLKELQDARKQRQLDLKDKTEREKMELIAKRAAIGGGSTLSGSLSTSSLGRRPASASLTREAARKLTRDFSRSSTGGPVRAGGDDSTTIDDTTGATNETPRPNLIRRGSVERSGSRNGSRTSTGGTNNITPTTPTHVPKGGIPRRATLPSGGLPAAVISGPSSVSGGGATVTSPTGANNGYAPPPRPGSSQGSRRMSSDVTNRKGSSNKGSSGKVSSTPRGTSTTLVGRLSTGGTTTTTATRPRSASRDARQPMSRGHSRNSSREFTVPRVTSLTSPNHKTATPPSQQPSEQSSQQPSNDNRSKTADLLATYADPNATPAGVSSDAAAVAAALRRLEQERQATNGTTSDTNDMVPPPAVTPLSTVSDKKTDTVTTGATPKGTENTPPRLTPAHGTDNGAVRVNGRPSTGASVVASAPGTKNITRRGSTGLRSGQPPVRASSAAPHRIRDPSPATHGAGITPTHATGRHKRAGSIGSSAGDRGSSAVRGASRDPVSRTTNATTPSAVSSSATTAAPAKRSFAAFSSQDGAAVSAVAIPSSESFSSDTDANNGERPPFVVPLETRGDDEIRREERRADAQRRLDEATLNGSGSAPPPGSLAPAKRRGSGGLTTPRGSSGTATSLLGTAADSAAVKAEWQRKESKRKDDAKSREDKLKDHRAKEKALREEKQAQLQEKEEERRQRRAAEDRARELKRRELAAREQRRRDEMAEAQKHERVQDKHRKERLARELEEEESLRLAKKAQLVEAKLARIRQMQERLELKKVNSGSLTAGLTLVSPTSPPLKSNTASSSAANNVPSSTITSGTSGASPNDVTNSSTSSSSLSATAVTGSNTVTQARALSTPAHHGMNGGPVASPFSTAINNVSYAVSSLASPVIATSSGNGGNEQPSTAGVRPEQPPATAATSSILASP